MATYTLIPSSLTGGTEINNASNAYTDTSSTTSARVYASSSYPAWLGGFDFSVIPFNESVTSITVKVKCLMSNGYRDIVLLSEPTKIELTHQEYWLSSRISDNITTERTETLTLTADVDTILAHADTLCIAMAPYVSNSYYIWVYGAEIIVETVPIVPNKVIYGNNTLIDLTGDTATASDVASGKTFHLASGLQATGALSVKTATSKPTSTSKPQTVSFTNLQNEPSWFVLCATNNNSVSMSRPVCYIVYDGETTTTFYASSTSSSSNVSTHEVTSGNSAWTFSYSSGTLTLSSTSSTSSPILNHLSNSTLYYI